MKFVKLIQPGFENYNGYVGQFVFENAVSVEPLDDMDADRIAASLRCEFLDAKGAVIIEATDPAQRLIAHAALRADVEPSLRRQSDAERVQETAEIAVSTPNTKTQIYTAPELESAAKEGGIKALRVIAAPWSVKHRSIPVLIGMILDAQHVYTTNMENRLAKANKAVADETAAEDETGYRQVQPSADPLQNITVDQIHRINASRVGTEAEDMLAEALAAAAAAADAADKTDVETPEDEAK